MCGFAAWMLTYFGQWGASGLEAGRGLTVLTWLGLHSCALMIHWGKKKPRVAGAPSFWLGNECIENSPEPNIVAWQHTVGVTHWAQP